MKASEETFTVTNIDKAGKETQVHMESDKGNKVRFYAAEKAWTFKAFITGKISARKLSKIIDIWYVGEKSFKAQIGDSVKA